MPPMDIVRILLQLLLLQSLILIVVVLLLLVLLLVVVLLICLGAILLVRVTVHVISLHFNPIPEPGFYHMYCMKNRVFLLRIEERFHRNPGLYSNDRKYYILCYVTIK